MRKSVQKSSVSPQLYLKTEKENIIVKYRQSLMRMRSTQHINYEDQSQYEGEVNEQGYRNGRGIFYASDGSVYLGQWYNNNYHGEGIYIYPDGERYEGELYDGQKEGIGKYYYSNGEFYIGEWNSNEKHGNGQHIYSNGEKYVGQWQDSEREGLGKLYLNGSVVADGRWQGDYFIEGFVNTKCYEGEFKNNAFNGEGVYKFADGSIYRGEWKNGQKHGEGCLTFSNGDVFQGQFERGIKHGQGIYKYYNGDFYEGQYQNDLKEGQGRLRFVNGDEYEGGWVRDQFHGKGKYLFNQKQTLIGQFKMGKFVSHQQILIQMQQQRMKTPPKQPQYKPSQISNYATNQVIYSNSKVFASPSMSKSNLPPSYSKVLEQNKKSPYSALQQSVAQSGLTRVVEQKSRNSRRRLQF